ncbi:hypothetical protein GCM10007103_34350 [Salinimicrobium marinum]|uniref:Uncharacterized protein n=1 Tax=Salinimicrobium marinum TaxID=680283 RepID=A0A918W0F5_9FLAO|nr:hypothetical protein GCM10007103_34350 [Salinimicrobium marinum]
MVCKELKILVPFHTRGGLLPKDGGNFGIQEFIALLFSSCFADSCSRKGKSVDGGGPGGSENPREEPNPRRLEGPPAEEGKFIKIKKLSLRGSVAYVITIKI